MNRVIVFTGGIGDIRCCLVEKEEFNICNPSERSPEDLDFTLMIQCRCLSSCSQRNSGSRHSANTEWQ